MSTDLAVRSENGLSAAGAQMPDWMRAEMGEVKPEGLQNLSQYFIPPVVKLVQPQTAGELRKRFKVGSVVILPMGTVASQAEEEKPGPQFTFVPILQFTEFVAFNPYAPEKLPTVRLDSSGNPMRTMDANSPLARRCRDFKNNSEDCPEIPGKQIKYREVNNFLVVIDSVPELRGVPCLMRFMSDAFKDGKLLSTFLTIRNAHIYANRFGAQVVGRNKNGNDYFAITVLDYPEDGLRFVQEQSDYNRYKSLHTDMMSKFRAGEIQTQYEDTVIDAEGHTVSVSDGLDPSDTESESQFV